MSPEEIVERAVYRSLTGWARMVLAISRPEGQKATVSYRSLPPGETIFAPDDIRAIACAKWSEVRTQDLDTFAAFSVRESEVKT